MPLFASPTRLVPYFGYRNEHRLVLTARALRGGEPAWGQTSTFAKLRTMLAQLASREVSDLVVTLAASHGERSVEARCVSDSEGFCRFNLALGPGWALPERSQWEAVTLRWQAGGMSREATGYVLAPGHSRRLGIISDIDDTIVETGAGDLLRNWRRIFAQMPGERLPVPGAAQFYEQLGGPSAGDHVPASERPFFYVSSSPWNLFDYLVAFKRAHRLPLGPMALRDWGLNRTTLGGSAHGAHKQAAIAELLDFYPEHRFALIGDSTQADSEAFAAVVAKHPERIAGVLVRKAPGAAVDPAEERALAAIGEAGVPVWLGDSFAVDAAFLDQLGLPRDGNVAAVLEESWAPAASAAIQQGKP